MSHQPRKRFGQHFLHDPAVIQRIIDAIAPGDGIAIVEIGPGRGALTVALLQRAGKLDVVEIDRHCWHSNAGDWVNCISTSGMPCNLTTAGCTGDP